MATLDPSVQYTDYHESLCGVGHDAGFRWFPLAAKYHPFRECTTVREREQLREGRVVIYPQFLHFPPKSRVNRSLSLKRADMEE